MAENGPPPQNPPAADPPAPADPNNITIHTVTLPSSFLQPLTSHTFDFADEQYQKLCTDIQTTYHALQTRIEQLQQLTETNTRTTRLANIVDHLLYRSHIIPLQEGEDVQANQPAAPPPRPRAAAGAGAADGQAVNLEPASEVLDPIIRANRTASEQEQIRLQQRMDTLADEIDDLAIKLQELVTSRLRADEMKADFDYDFVMPTIRAEDDPHRRTEDHIDYKTLDIAVGKVDPSNPQANLKFTMERLFSYGQSMNFTEKHFLTALSSTLQGEYFRRFRELTKQNYTFTQIIQSFAEQYFERYSPIIAARELEKFTRHPGEHIRSMISRLKTLVYKSQSTVEPEDRPSREKSLLTKALIELTTANTSKLITQTIERRRMQGQPVLVDDLVRLVEITEREYNDIPAKQSASLIELHVIDRIARRDHSQFLNGRGKRRDKLGDHRADRRQQARDAHRMQQQQQQQINPNNIPLPPDNPAPQPQVQPQPQPQLQAPPQPQQQALPQQLPALPPPYQMAQPRQNYTQPRWDQYKPQHQRQGQRRQRPQHQQQYPPQYQFSQPQNQFRSQYSRPPRPQQQFQQNNRFQQYRQSRQNQQFYPQGQQLQQPRSFQPQFQQQNQNQQMQHQNQNQYKKKNFQNYQNGQQRNLKPIPMCLKCLKQNVQVTLPVALLGRYVHGTCTVCKRQYTNLQQNSYTQNFQGYYPNQNQKQFNHISGPYVPAIQYNNPTDVTSIPNPTGPPAITYQTPTPAQQNQLLDMVDVNTPKITEVNTNSTPNANPPSKSFDTPQPNQSVSNPSASSIQVNHISAPNVSPTTVVDPFWTNP